MIVEFNLGGLVKSIILLGILASFVSCGKSSGPGAAAKKITLTQEQINSIMDNQNFSCDDGGRNTSCPEAIARLFILNPYNPEESNVCSGFMIGQNRLVTNNHCVPSQEACRNTYIAIYHPHYYQRVGCRKILDSQNDSSSVYDTVESVARDYTVLEIDQYWYGNTFKASSASADIGDSLDAWVVDHIGLDSESFNLTDARITRLECVVEKK